MKNTIKIIIVFVLIIVVIIIAYAEATKYIANALRPTPHYNSLNLEQSMEEGRFLASYKLTKDSRKIADSLGFKINTAWGENLYCYEAEYFGKISKVRAKTTGLVFPIQNILTESGYLFYSLELYERQGNPVSGYDTKNNSYTFSPYNLDKTLDFAIYKKDSIEGWKKPKRIGKLTLVQQ